MSTSSPEKTPGALECVGPECRRSFIDESAFQAHVGIVHPELTAEAVEEARKFAADERKKAAKSGQAMPGGGFPIKSAEDLMNAIKALGRAKDKAAAKAHIIKRAKALGLTKNLPSGWTSDGARALDCPDCDRTFLDDAAFLDHAESVHTFDDIRMIVAEAVREKFATGGDYPNRIYTYVADIADDWVVFEASQGSQCDNYKCSYSILDNVATLGEIAEVRRRTVWEPVGGNEPAGILTTKENN